MSGQRYTPEFKEEAVKQVTVAGHSVADVAQRLGTTTHSLYAWIKRYGPDKVNEMKKLPRKNKLAIRYEYLKASIQAKVEHPFRIVKCQFGFVKVRYKELAKNDSQLVMLFNLANLVGVDQLISAQARST
jgi:IS5 family transposase